MKKNPPLPISLRLSPELTQDVQQATEMIGMSQAEVMRLSIAIGLKELRAIDYDIAGAAHTAAKSTAPKLVEMEEVRKTGTNSAN